MTTIQRVGIVGAGTMGNGIAQACAASGLDAVMIDVAEAAVMRGLAAISAASTAWSRRKRSSAADKDAALLAHQGFHRLRRSQSCDLVIEAATENLDLKLKIIRQIDGACETVGAGRVEHVVDLDHGARRGHVAARAIPRHPLLQSGAA